MARNFRDKIALSGVTVLAIGVILLVFTFACAYGFLSEALPILTSQDLVQAFGETLAPLIASSIRVMYLGVMGWIGSLITIRGVTIIANTPKIGTSQPLKPQEVKAVEPQTQPRQLEEEASRSKETKIMTKPTEPEMVVIPLEEMEQQNARS
jgi:hypothetical protein